LLEGLFLSLIGYLFGLVLSTLAQFVVSKVLSNSNFAEIKIGQFGESEIYLLLMALLVGILSAALPALGIYNINISKTLAKD
jgi:putative ABC transport system permease protein